MLDSIAATHATCDHEALVEGIRKNRDESPSRNTNDVPKSGARSIDRCLSSLRSRPVGDTAAKAARYGSTTAMKVVEVGWRRQQCRLQAIVSLEQVIAFRKSLGAHLTKARVWIGLTKRVGLWVPLGRLGQSLYFLASSTCDPVGMHGCKARPNTCLPAGGQADFLFSRTSCTTIYLIAEAPLIFSLSPLLKKIPRQSFRRR